MLDRAAALGLNAVVLQVRPACDAIYASTLEPWSEYLSGTQGQAPGYDPLALWIDEAHARGIELHQAGDILGAIDANGRTLDLSSRADQGRYGRTRQRDIEAFAKERPVIELARLGRRPPPSWRTMLPLEALRASAARMNFPPLNLR